MENQCIMCGNEAELGGYTSRINGHVLRPLCGRCDELCSSQPDKVLNEYPSLFAPSGTKQSPTAESPTVKGSDDTPTSSITSESHPAQPESRRQFVKRYVDLYRAARLLVGLGNTVKVVGISAGAGILLLFTFVGMVAATQSGAAFFVMFVVGAVSGVMVGGIIFLLGILISAQGQILLAQADAAVHTSPFMTETEKLSAMSLPS